jgi:hypothetical protein
MRIILSDTKRARHHHDGRLKNVNLKQSNNLTMITNLKMVITRNPFYTYFPSLDNTGLCNSHIPFGFLLAENLIQYPNPFLPCLGEKDLQLKQQSGSSMSRRCFLFI